MSCEVNAGEREGDEEVNEQESDDTVSLEHHLVSVETPRVVVGPHHVLDRRSQFLRFSCHLLYDIRNVGDRVHENF